MAACKLAAHTRRRPWVLARQCVTLDQLSGGRLILGVGIGNPPAPEFGAFGEETDDRIRADMLDEGLEILAGMWSGEPFGFESIQQYERGEDQWPADIAAWRVAGGSHISVVTMGAGLTTVDAHIDAIRRWREVYDTTN